MTIESTLLRSEPVADQPPRSECQERALLIAAVQAELAELARSVDSARALVTTLAQADLRDEAARHELPWQVTRRIPRWHFPMLNDGERNDAFATGLERAITAGDIVLDIGSGTGLLAMLAVQAGAGHVYTCEADPVLAEIARQVVATNGLSDRITVLTAMSTDLVVGR